jgi:hypothetical protein
MCTERGLSLTRPPFFTGEVNDGVIQQSYRELTITETANRLRRIMPG